MHDNTNPFLQGCVEKGIVLNPDKLEYGVTSIPFLSHLLTSEGLKPDPEKISAILDTPTPDDVAAIHRFIGPSTTWLRFCPTSPTSSNTLTALTQKDVPWTWGPEHENVVDTMESVISRNPILRHYDPDDDLVIQCDASKDGLGACVMQKGQPNMYTSHMITSAEQC